MMEYVVSACLAGIQCRFDAKSCRDQQVVELVKHGLALPICPELLGGLAIPRTPCEIRIEDGMRAVVDQSGRDRTAEFKRGAEKTLAICQCIGVEKVLLRRKSPSCGCEQVYDGTFSGRLVSGRGITAALLVEHGLDVEGVEPNTNREG